MIKQLKKKYEEENNKFYEQVIFKIKEFEVSKSKDKDIINNILKYKIESKLIKKIFIPIYNNETELKLIENKNNDEYLKEILDKRFNNLQTDKEKGKIISIIQGFFFNLLKFLIFY